MNTKKQLSVRLNVLFFSLFLLFSVLILRLGFIQIVQGEEFANELATLTNTTSKTEAPRGLMIDRNGYVVVDNQLELSLTYTNPSRQTKPEFMLQIAKDLEPMLEVETSRISELNKKEYLLLQMEKEQRYKLVSRVERSKLSSASKEYRLEIERIPEELVNKLTERDYKVIALYREMRRGYANIPQRIKQQLTEKEAHIISENLDHLPGIDILRDSKRTYLYGDSFRSFFGTTNAIPSERINYYLSHGYDRSDLVGTSFLEAYYEDVLRGQKAVVEKVTKRKGAQETKYETNEKLGKRGNDLVLTLDMELQQQLEEILANEMRRAGKKSFILDRSAYAVLMDPRTGDLLAMAGFSDPANQKRTSYADHIGIVTKSFEMGSSIKAASVLTGFQAGIIRPGDTFLDAPIKLPATQEKKSWTAGLGVVNDIRALEQSSNVFMFQIGMRMAKCYYRGENQRCGWNHESIQQAYDDVRHNFSQFGLGSKTGIDLPSYSSGLTGGREIGGNLMDLMIGQYDTYTTLQLTQYIATIANNGYRMQPRIVREIREPVINSDDPIVTLQRFEPKILNRIDMSDYQIKRVQEGLRGVMTRGTARKRFSNVTYQPAGKTGTAQVQVPVGEGANRRYVEGNTQTLVGYAPYVNPEVAFAVVVPNVKIRKQGGRQGIAQDIAHEALSSYFKLKKGRHGPKLIIDS
ncbi:peptidoglycan D,D-transpeptidase FtsI family protein [Bacillus solitudinis]|uniref:peptidoglycan D,D-transpeptidase FtsI family protein n=1 Tax=Bacillus solitudinis TaxID=2014074 RepID=UPI000C237E67|nr:penicillin-binding protein 2 [Bacillus solitudinis]